MQKQISPKIVSLVFAVLVVGFLTVFYVFAWTEPTAVPPGGNVPAPLNVSDNEQQKTGALRLGGLTVDHDTYLAVDGGNVGIGTTSLSQKLDVSGQIHATGDICTDQEGGVCLSTSMNYEIRTNDCNVVVSNDNQMCGVACSAGKYVLGGGCWILDTEGNTAGTIQNSHPTNGNTQWWCSYSSIRTDPGVVRVEAICANIR